MRCYLKAALFAAAFLSATPPLLADDPPAPVDADTARTNKANADKAEAEAREAVANAEKAAIEARIAAAKARAGVGPTASGLTGEVTVGDTGGDSEATLLAAKAVETAARQIADEMPGGPGKIVIQTGEERTDLGIARTFILQTKIIKGMSAAAKKKKESADDSRGAYESQGVGTMGFPGAITTIGAGVQVASQIGSYFQSDYAVSGSKADSADSELLALNVAHLLSGRAYYPQRLSGIAGDDELLRWLSELELRRSADTSAEAELTASKTALEANVPKDDAPEKKKSQYKTAVAAHNSALSAYASVLNAYDALNASLAAEKDKVKVTSLLADQLHLLCLAQPHRCDLSGDATGDAQGAPTYVLYLKVAPVGSDYSDKNLWTFFGGMPFYVMGGAVASYALSDISTGQIAKSGHVIVHGGYTRIDKVQAKVNSIAPPAKAPMPQQSAQDPCKATKGKKNRNGCARDAQPDLGDAM